MMDIPAATIIYDCEIVRAIQGRGEPRLPGIEYCGGWDDIENMGISVIGCYDVRDHRYRVFMRDNLDSFRALVDEAELIVGFNCLAFDNRLLRANGVAVDDERSYDLLVEMWRAHGLPGHYAGSRHNVFSLDACARANLGQGKSGHGELAPVLYQRGQYGELVDYCLQDVRLTWGLFSALFMQAGCLVSPKTNRRVPLRHPAHAFEKELAQ